MAFQTTGARHTLGGALWSLVERVWNPCRALWNPVKPRAHSPRRILWNPETLIQPYLKPPRTTPQPSQNLVGPCQNRAGMEPYLAKPGGILVEFLWNMTSNQPGWWNHVNPCGTFPGPRRTLEEIGGTLVEPSSGARRAGGTLNPRGTVPQTTSDHPAALAEPGETLGNCWNPGGTLVEPYLKPPRTTLQPWWNPRGTLPQTTQTTPNPGRTLVEPWWNPGGTLAQGRPEPPQSLSGLRPQSFQLLGKKRKRRESERLVSFAKFRHNQVEVRLAKLQVISPSGLQPQDDKSGFLSKAGEL